MKVYVDLDIFIYKVVARLQPNYYWVGDKFFNSKKEAIIIANEDDEIIKQECLEAPWRVPYVVKEVITKLEDKINTVTEGKGKIFYFLSGDNNFRKQLSADYKANRPVKPFYTKYVKECLREYCKAISQEGLEADDMMSLAAEMDLANSLIVSTDKDLLNIPTRHYNPDTGKVKLVSPELGLRTFLKQVVTGDSVDNIRGVKGLGSVAAKNIVDNLYKLDWDTFIKDLDAYCYTKETPYLRSDVELDATLLDVGLFYTRKLQLDFPEVARENFRSAWKVLRGLK